MPLLPRKTFPCIWKASVRFFSGAIKNKNVRVRFAPSPTGHLHLGGLRTALYNYLFALKNEGTAILRIEDTDQTRKVDGAMEALIDDLRWVGIEFHESPIAGGAHGPYVQSERLHIYKEYVKRLLENETAYCCFCTDARLSVLKRDAVKNRLVPKYDNRCRHLSKSETLENIKSNKPYCIRFKLSSNCTTFEDIIYGSIAYDVSSVEGDPVVMKSDGYPTYHFANVVDDHLMDISHVLRGVEWQISTTKHLQLYNAFGWKPPIFGHLPLIMNSDGTKLSKRQSDIRVEDYRKRGILPNALLNYVTFAGGGFSRFPGEGISPTTMEELIDQFDITKINCHSSRLNPDLLVESNRLELKQMITDDVLVEQLIKDVKNILKTNFTKEILDMDEDYIKSILKWAGGRITSLDDLISPSLSFLWVLPTEKSLNDSEIGLINEFSKEIDCKNIESLHLEDIKSFLKVFCTEHDIAFNKFMGILRRILSGLKEGPSVAEMIQILGKNTVMKRINNVTVRS